MSDYPLSNATMESGAWKYVVSGNTVTAPNNTNLGAGIGQLTVLDMIPCKANASLFAPSVGTWVDKNGKKRDIDLTMYAASYNGGGISSRYGKKNVLSFMAGPDMASTASGVACDCCTSCYSGPHRLLYRHEEAGVADLLLHTICTKKSGPRTNSPSSRFPSRASSPYMR